MTMPKPLSGQVALVTGASRGIGRSIALELAQKGARLGLAARSGDLLQGVAAEIAATGGEAFARVTDLVVEDQVEGLFESIRRRWGRLDVLVNNAALAYDTSRHFLGLTTELWDATLAANLRSLYLCSVRAARLMATQGSGCIVNLSACGGTRAHRNDVAYDASKGGVDAATRAMALDLAPYGIRVNAVAPGAILVEAWGELTEDELARRRATIPLGRLGTPRDVARVVAFLCSGDAAYMTGQILYVDGGLLAQLRSPQAEISAPEGPSRASARPLET